MTARPKAWLLGGRHYSTAASLALAAPFLVLALVTFILPLASLLHESQSMHYGEKLPYVVGAVHRTEVEHLRSGGKVDGLIFHRTGISGAGCIHSPGVRLHLIGQRQDCIVSP